MVYLVKDKNDFDTKLAEAGENLVVVDFFATWCGPCKMIAPKIEEFSNEFPNVVFLKVDVDENEELASVYKVDSMPTFMFFKNKERIDSFSGANVETLRKTVLEYK